MCINAIIQAEHLVSIGECHGLQVANSGGLNCIWTRSIAVLEGSIDLGRDFAATQGRVASLNLAF